MRGQAWPLLVGNKLRITNQIFEVFKRHPEMVSTFKYKEGEETQFDFYMIDVDLPRTFPELNSLFE